MIIVCATDGGYAEFAGVLLRSIAAKGEVPEAKIFVLGDRLSERDKAWIKASAPGLDVAVIDIDLARDPRVAGLPLAAYWTHASYARLFIPDFLPRMHGKALFLDVDTIVNGSLRPLFETDLDGAVLGAVPNAGDPDHLARINRVVGRGADQPNYNAGVLLIDLDRWRDERITDLCLDFLKLTPVLNFLDQDALNAVLGDRVRTLDRQWNFWAVRPDNLTRADYESARIIHFTTRIKPNMVESRHPARDLYLAHRAHTPWRDQPLMTRQPGGLRRLIVDVLRRIHQKPQGSRVATGRDIARAARMPRRN